MNYDVCVIGAGPAGLAAAATAARGGATVALIDAGQRVGGQFWRHRESGIAADADLYHDLALFRKLAPGSGVDHLAAHQVWSVAAGSGGSTVYALAAQREVTVQARYLVLAPGAYDRQVPFPGWDLPGVMTAGGVQALLKGQGVVAGKRVLVAGTGPFLLPVAAGLAARGATVVGIHEANQPAAWLRHPAHASGKLPEALGYLRVLLRHRVPVRHRSVLIAAEGVNAVTAARVARISPDGRGLRGTGRRIPADVIAVGWGFTPQIELVLAAGCDTHVDADSSVVAVVDDAQFTSQPRVLAAGEVTGVGGAGLALAEGAIAGSSAAAAAGHRELPRRVLDRLRRSRTRLRAFADVVRQVYPVPSAWTEQLTDSTVACRCEEVTVGALRGAVELGAADVRTAKLLSRTGMGLCQGRVCGYAAACLLSRWTGLAFDQRGLAERPVAAPVPLAALAGNATPAAPCS